MDYNKNDSKTPAALTLAMNVQADPAQGDRDCGVVCMDTEDVARVMGTPGDQKMNQFSARNQETKKRQHRDEKIEHSGSGDDRDRPTLRHHTRHISSGRKRSKADDESKSSSNARANADHSPSNEWDQSAASSESSMNSSPSDETNRSSSGYEGGKSGSNGTSSDSMSVACRGTNGSGSGSGSGSDDGYYNNGKSVTFSQMPSSGGNGMDDGIDNDDGGRSPTNSSSSYCSSDDYPGQVDSKPSMLNSRNRSEDSSGNMFSSPISAKSGIVKTSDDKAPSSTVATECGTQLSSDTKCRKSSRRLKPAPYFYYIDRSRDPDEDPLSPLTLPLYVPSFAAKVSCLIGHVMLRNEIAFFYVKRLQTCLNLPPINSKHFRRCMQS